MLQIESTMTARDPIGLYLHIPFCTAKCGYCDFNSYAGHDHTIPAYTQSLLKDASLWRDASAGRSVETVFFGGGTPSLNPLPEMQALLAGFRETFDIAPDAEVSLEANPGSLSVDYLRGLRDIGFNRLSIGVQSFDDEELVSLDRIHTGDDARAAYAAAREAGFDNVNLDLIYGLPEQPLAKWQASLETALALAPEHLSLYALTVEEGTPLARDIARGRTSAPDPDEQATHYEYTQDRLARAGYEHYEISNWARPGRRCRHNLVYWQHREYLGLGAGAHSYLDGARFSMVLLPNRYSELVDESLAAGDGKMRHIASAETPSRETAIADALILGLRLIDGVDVRDFARRHGAAPDDVYGDILREFESYGILERTATHLRLTKKGLLLSNELFLRLLPEPAEPQPA
jgi:oxygen-independent coproporphyrinogen-3 oxidase